MTLRRVPVRWLVPALLLGALAFAPFDFADGSCAAPNLRIGMGSDARPALRIGSAVTVNGRHFAEGCDDQGGGSTLGCDDAGEDEVPLEDVTLVLHQGSRHWDLGTRDAGTADEGRLGHVTWGVTIPGEARPGKARLVAGTAEQAVTIGRAR